MALTQTQRDKFCEATSYLRSEASNAAFAAGQANMFMRTTYEDGRANEQGMFDMAQQRLEEAEKNIQTCLKMIEDAKASLKATAGA